MSSNRRRRVLLPGVASFIGRLVDQIYQRNQLRIGHRRCAARPVVEDGERGSQADGDLLASETRNDELQQTLTGAFLHGGTFSARLGAGTAQSVPPWTNWRLIFGPRAKEKKSPDWRSPYFRACVSNPEEEVKRDSLKLRACSREHRVVCRARARQLIVGNPRRIGGSPECDFRHAR